MMNKYSFKLLLVLIFSSFIGCGEYSEIPKVMVSDTSQDIGSEPDENDNKIEYQDFLTPNYYLLDSNDNFVSEIDQFLKYVRKQKFNHPFENVKGDKPQISIPENGEFKAERGGGTANQYHSALDMHLQGDQTSVSLYAAHEGYVSTYKDADKYRHYLSITKDIESDDGSIIGKLVTIYAHVDLDLDESEQIWMDGLYVKKGDLVSKNLYEGTKGGPHLHFEIRYYRFYDNGTETFYGASGGDLTQASAGDFTHGFWDTDVGYGFGNPENHGLLTNARTFGSKRFNRNNRGLNNFNSNRKGLKRASSTLPLKLIKNWDT